MHLEHIAHSANVLECVSDKPKMVGNAFDRILVINTVCERLHFPDAPPPDPHTAVAAVLMFWVAGLLFLIKGRP